MDISVVDCVLIYFIINTCLYIICSIYSDIKRDFNEEAFFLTFLTLGLPVFILAVIYYLANMIIRVLK